MELDYAAIGNRIRVRRHMIGLTQERLAELCSLSLSFLGHIERGTRKMSLETLAALARALGTSTDFLLFGGVCQEGLSAVLSSPSFQNEEQRKRFSAAVNALILGKDAF